MRRALLPAACGAHTTSRACALTAGCGKRSRRAPPPDAFTRVHRACHAARSHPPPLLSSLCIPPQLRSLPAVSRAPVWVPLGHWHRAPPPRHPCPPPCSGRCRNFRARLLCHPTIPPSRPLLFPAHLPPDRFFPSLPPPLPPRIPPAYPPRLSSPCPSALAGSATPHPAVPLAPPFLLTLPRTTRIHGVR